MSDIDKAQTGVLYHVTIGDHVDSICSNGIDPAYSSSKFKASWFVSKDNILWAVAHVSNRHAVSVADIYVCRVTIDWRTMRRSNRQGIFYTTSVFCPDDVSPASWLLGEN